LYPEFLKGKAIPVLIGAGVSIFLVKSGFLFLFFLVPLGFLAYKYSGAVGWVGVLAAVLGYTVFTALNASGGSFAADAKWNLLYYMIMSAIFMWIIAPPRGFSLKIRMTTRFISGSIAGALLLTILLLWMLANPMFLEEMESLLKAFAAGNNADVVRSAIMEGLTVDMVVEMMKGVMLRGGSLAVCVFIFFICRQFSLSLANATTKAKAGENIERRIAGFRKNSLAAFHVNPQFVWVFSLSLFLVVLTRIFRIEIPEIILWNVLILCVMLYLAQGLGILQFFLTKPSKSPFPRFLFVILFFVLLFSPVINVVLLGGLVLLGIAENWVPIRRAPGKNGSPSTPEAGKGGV